MEWSDADLSSRMLTQAERLVEDWPAERRIAFRRDASAFSE